MSFRTNIAGAIRLAVLTVASLAIVSCGKAIRSSAVELDTSNLLPVGTLVGTVQKAIYVVNHDEPVEAPGAQLLKDLKAQCDTITNAVIAHCQATLIDARSACAALHGETAPPQCESLLKAAETDCANANDDAAKPACSRVKAAKSVKIAKAVLNLTTVAKNSKSFGADLYLFSFAHKGGATESKNLVIELQPSPSAYTSTQLQEILDPLKPNPAPVIEAAVSANPVDARSNKALSYRYSVQTRALAPAASPSVEVNELEQAIVGILRLAKDIAGNKSGLPDGAATPLTLKNYTFTFSIENATSNGFTLGWKASPIHAKGSIGSDSERNLANTFEITLGRD
ncbi:MAG: hypothetical protein ABI411_17700 [Tahibacter sp.]